MTKINLLRKSTTFDPSAGSYRMVLEVLSTENIPRHVFINQRLRNFVKNNFEDVFAAISTPAQLEDFDIDSPAAGTSFFRVYKIDLVSRNAAYLEEVFESILSELQKLVDDYTALSNLTADAIYTITADSVEMNTAIVHTHYRLPLVAEPSGTNEIFDDSGTNYHRVASQDTDKTGWLNCVTGDPLGYKFKYNIAADTTLAALWPPTSDKIGYAHLELNGVTHSTVLLTPDGIYWKENTEGEAPWPVDYVSSLNTSPSGEVVRLLLDIII